MKSGSKREVGILLHPTSLPNASSLGSIGEAAFRFIDFLDECGIGIWQILPLHPTGEAFSPYSSPSAFAGNTDFISRKSLVDDGFLQPKEASYNKPEALKIAFEHFKANASNEEKNELEGFLEKQKSWLQDFALFTVIKTEHDDLPWSKWPQSLRDRDSQSLTTFAKEHSEQLQEIYFQQFLFFTQWSQLRDYANKKNIKILGDVPIFVAHDSADVWANQNLFRLDETGEPEVVAGVPPDYFSEDGQRWGNPLYDWDAMEAEHFGWWQRRINHELTLVDSIRIDHFRGFEACWEIPATEETAKVGQWIKVPGRALFSHLFREEFADTETPPIVAEDLGIITKEVEALRKDLNIPGMKVLQFAFSNDSTNPYLPHNHEANSVVFTGTHDNNTTLGWYKELSAEEKDHINQYLAWPSEVMPWALVKTALASVANWAIIPIQDILALDSQYRMNTPGTVEGNWQFQFHWDQLTEDKIKYLKFLVNLYGRHKDDEES